MSPKEKWRYTIEMINACNCDWGCPCNFNQPPTKGFCTGAYAANVRTGYVGDQKLDSVKFVWAAKWPHAIHEGGGTAKVLISEKASIEQRASLGQVLKGELGGLPWSIFRNTIDEWLDVSYVPFQWNFDGVNSWYKAGTEAQASLAPMRNPVTGAEAEAKILLPDGLVTKELNPTATKTYSVFTHGLKFAAPGQYGFYTVTEHTNE